MAAGAGEQVPHRRRAGTSLDGAPAGARLGDGAVDLRGPPDTVVSLDYIKAERRRQEFLRTCPHLVVVDEAHTCAASAGSCAQHLRHQLVRDLARDGRRHLLLVTATPHSGREDAFRSLLALLDPSLAELPDDLSGPERIAERRRIARYFVQRRRADIRHFLDQTTMFPQREEAEETYRLTPAYRRLFERVLAYAREQVADPTGTLHQRRVRWWSALALLRCMASSPAAAAATLRARADTADTEDAEEADAIRAAHRPGRGRHQGRGEHRHHTG